MSTENRSWVPPTARSNCPRSGSNHRLAVAAAATADLQHLVDGSSRRYHAAATAGLLTL